MPGTFLFRARTALFHLVKLDCKQQRSGSVFGPRGSYSKPCSAVSFSVSVPSSHLGVYDARSTV